VLHGLASRKDTGYQYYAYKKSELQLSSKRDRASSLKDNSDGFWPLAALKIESIVEE
jgi:hypothetical protein